MHSSLDSNKKCLKLTPSHLTSSTVIRYKYYLLTYSTLLVMLASFFINILLFLSRYLMFLNLATRIFVTFAASVNILISKQISIDHHCYLHRSL